MKIDLDGGVTARIEYLEKSEQHKLKKSRKNTHLASVDFSDRHGQWEVVVKLGTVDRSLKVRPRLSHGEAYLYSSQFRHINSADKGKYFSQFGKLSQKRKFADMTKMKYTVEIGSSSFSLPSSSSNSLLTDRKSLEQ